jgi:predicted transposase YbfD/YdcC
LEIRSLQCLEVTPRQAQFPGTRLVARLETRVKRQDPQTKKKKWSREVVYLVCSLTLAELQAQGLLCLKRGYWVVESRLHHCLDITLREDTSRVRTPKAARTLGTIRRVMVSLANAAVNRARRKSPKTKCNTGSFQKRFKSARGGRERLHALITAKFPNIHDL